MNNSIVSLLQNLGKENSVEVIADFMIRNPEIKDLVAAKMGSIQASSSVTSTALTLQKGLTPRIPNSFAAAMSGSVSGSHKLIHIVHHDYHDVGLPGLSSLSWMEENPKSPCGGRIKGIETDSEQIRMIRAEAEEAGVANRLDSYKLPFMGTHKTPKRVMTPTTFLALYGSDEELKRLTGLQRLYERTDHISWNAGFIGTQTTTTNHAASSCLPNVTREETFEIEIDLDKIR